MARVNLKASHLRRLRDVGDHKPVQTVRLAEAFLRVYPDHGPTWITLAIARVAMAQYAEARRALQRAIKFCSTERINIPFAEMGHLYKQRGNFRRAALWYKRAIDAAPADASGYIYLGSLLALQGRLLEAEAQQRMATRCKQGCVDEAYLNLGLVLRAQGRFAEASASLERALELDPQYEVPKLALADLNGSGEEPDIGIRGDA